MTLLVLNIVLVLLGSASAATALFGETRYRNRLTKIGWVAFIGCAVTFGVGIAKEIVTKYEDDQNAVARQDQLDATFAELKSSKELLLELRKQSDNLQALVKSPPAVVKQPAGAASLPPGQIRGEVFDLEGKPVKPITVTVFDTKGQRLYSSSYTGNQFDIKFNMANVGATRFVSLLIQSPGRVSNSITGLSIDRGQSLSVAMPERVEFE